MVTLDREDGVGVLALRRPPVNAVDLDLVRALAEVVERVSEDAALRALVVTGAPGIFCAGIDFRALPTYDTETRREMLRTINRTILALYSLPRPVVAAVSGHAIGAGLVLALTADVRLAARGAFRLGLTEAQAGIPFPACPLAVVQGELPADTARRLCLTSQTAEPDSPLLRGAIDRVVEPAELLAEALAEARRLAQQPSHGVVKTQLRAATIARLREIVATDDDPLLTHWV